MFILFFLNLQLATNCPFSYYEEGLLSLDNQFTLTKQQISSKNIYGSFSVGYWMLPRVTMNTEYSLMNLEATVFTMTTDQYTYIKQNTKYNQIEKSYELTFHILSQIKGTKVINDVVFKLPFDKYQDFWQFVLITITDKLSTIIIEITGQQKQSISNIKVLGYDLVYYFKIMQGYEYLGKEIILYFQGRISQPIFFEDYAHSDQSFQSLQQTCQIPAQGKGEEIISITIDFGSKNEFMINFQQFGRKYVLSGWVKYIPKNLKFFRQVMSIRLSTNPNKPTKLFGDNLFKLETQVIQQDQIDANIGITIDALCDSQLTKLCQINTDTSNFYFEYLNSKEFQLYEGLQQWHFFQYEYGRYMDNGIEILFQIQFPNSVGYQAQKLSEIYKGSETNTQLFFIAGQKDYDMLETAFNKMEFNHNYVADKIFQGCNSKCKTCFGPSEYNCISCFDSQNRIFNMIDNTCSCKVEHMVMFQEDIICTPLKQIFPSIIIEEKQSIIENQCLLGYFRVIISEKEFQCIQCPQYFPNKILCADCWIDPLFWYLNPKCSLDYEKSENFQNAGYYLLDRAEKDIDIFILDENFNLIQLLGYQRFCQQNKNDPDCHTIKYKHLSKEIQAICKNKFYYFINECKLKDYSCEVYENDNKNCISCNPYMYLKDGRCFQCPKNCMQCYYDYSNQNVVCQQCQENFGILNNQCQSCGNFCSICLQRYSQPLKKDILKCIKCFHQTNYFISMNEADCLKNEISDCQQVLQMNLLGLYYNQDFQIDNIYEIKEPTCAKCENSQFFDTKTTSCNSQSSFFSIYPDRYNSNCIFYINYVCTQSQYSWEAFTYTQGCDYSLPNCNLCTDDQGYLICLMCFDGYYADRITGLCVECPSNYNCQKCGHQQKLTKDYLIVEQRPSIRAMLEAYGLSFRTQSQSQNIEDYEVICLSCQPNYVLVDQYCVPKCPQFCEQCELQKGKFICVKCPTSLNTLTIKDNQCIQCPNYCTLCRPRSLEEIANINIFFNDQTYITHSHQCLKSKETDQYFYNQFSGLFLECNELKYCTHQLTIKLNLICSQEEYLNQLNSMQTSSEKYNFYQQNILLKDLVSDLNFASYENDQFYKFANENIIEKLIIEITSDLEQTCYLDSTSTINQKFMNHIFSLQLVELILNFQQKTQFIYSDQLMIKNFNSIQFNNIEFVASSQQSLKKIIFTSIIQQSIFLTNISFTQENQIIAQSILIQVNSIQNFLLQDSTFFGLNLNNQNYFIQFQDQSFFKTIEFQNIQIINSQFQDLSFLFSYMNKNDILIMNDVYINSRFTHSSLIKAGYLLTESEQVLQTLMYFQKGNLQLQHFQIFVEIQNSQSLFNFETFEHVSIQDFFVKNSKITNSSIINLNQNSIIENFEIEASQLYLGSVIILNSVIQQIETLNFQFLNLTLQDNQYEPDCHLLTLQRLNSKTQNFYFNNLTLINNFGTNLFQVYRNFDNSLILLEGNQIYLENFLLIKKFGVMELFVKDAYNLTLINLKLMQNEDQLFLALHDQIDCFLKKLKSSTYVSAIFIYQTKFTLIKNMTISNLQLINFPIITFRSADIEIKQQEQIIDLEDIYILNNLLLQSDSLSILSIIYIYSQQIMKLQFEKLNFENNLFHSYQQNNLKSSSALINIDCVQCSISLKQSNFLSNLVTNSTDSIIYISSSSIIFQDCLFKYNSIFNYKILQPFLVWDFENEQVYLEQIIKIFPVISYTGNGLIISKNIQINNTNIQYSQGQFGGAFKFQTLNNAKILLNSIQLLKISNLFSQQSEQGGAFNIDGTQVQTLSIQINNISGQYIYGKDQGGLLYLLVRDQKVKIEINQVNLKDIYCKQGSFIFLNLLLLAKNQQTAIINNIKVQTSQNGFNDYLNYFKLFSQDDIEKIQQNRSIIYLQYGSSLRFKNIIVQNLIQESVFDLQGTQNVIISDIHVFQAIMSYFLIKIDPLKYTLNNFLIQNIKFEKITNQQLNFDMTCLQSQREFPHNSFQCLNQVRGSPLNVKEYITSAQKSFYQSTCINNTSTNQLTYFESVGLFVITEITKSSIILLNNISLNTIQCDSCQKGLIYLGYSNIKSPYFYNTTIMDIKIFNSLCGQQGCMKLQMLSQDNKQRLLYSLNQYSQESYVQISNYNCINNTATSGTCLIINNMNIALNSSEFLLNNASQKGGAIFIDSNSSLILNNNIIKYNKAHDGGGLYFANQQKNNIQQLKNIISNNIAEFESDNYKVYPEKLNLYLNFDVPLVSKTVFQNSTFKLDEIQTYQNQKIYLPSGQQISSYQRFNPNIGQYSQANLIFRIKAIQFDGSVSKNLGNTLCDIQSRKLNLSLKDEDQYFTDNFTNIKKVYFNSETFDYTLDDLIIYFDSNTSENTFLQLQFKCNCINISYYDSKFPYQAINIHNNYFLRINIHTLPCQYGEIKNETDHSCHVCDSSQGLFSLTLNSNKCSLKDDVTTLSVKSAQLELRKGYWRPYFDTNSISYCYNFPSNCLGSWIQGDNSCYPGHIGALCEQCDLDNIRGDGFYAISEKYQCGSCNQITRNLVLIILATIWTFVVLYFSVQGNQKMLDEFIKPSLNSQSRLVKNLDKSQTGILMKMLTNYFQIIASLTTFQLSLPYSIDQIINITGNPSQTTANSQDCFLNDNFQMSIQYSRTIWILIIPLFYIVVFLLIYRIASHISIATLNQSVIVTTILYIYIYFHPNIVESLIQIVSFREISGYRWIKANVAERYDTNSHFHWMIQFALPFLLIMAFVIPLVLFLILYNKRNSLDTKINRTVWGYIYHEYKIKVFFWEIVKILQKELIILFLNFYDEVILVKGILVLLTTFTYSQLNIIYQPYEIKSLNLLDYSSANVCTLSLGLAIGLQVSIPNSLFEIQISFWILLIFFNLRFLLKILYMLGQQYLKKFDAILDDVIDKLKYKFPYIKKFEWTNRKQKKKRILFLYKKLQQYLMPIARSSLKNKQQKMNQQTIYFKSLPFSKESLAIHENFSRQTIIKENDDQITLINMPSQQLETQKKDCIIEEIENKQI